MTIERVIQLAGMIERGNVLPEELAMEFLSEFDGMIQSDIMLHAPEEIVHYDNKAQELLLRKPHDGLYVSFLVAMIRQCQGEFEGYDNAQEIVQDKLKTFRRWYISHYRPADTGSRDYTGGTSGGAFGFAYLSAYGLAVKHGYQGTEEEWLESLKGAKGDAGAAARMRYDAERDMIQWGVGEEWHDLYTMAEVLAPLYAKLEEMTARAETAATDAEAAATEAREAESRARGALAATTTQADIAQAAAEGAAGSAESAAASEQSTALMRDEVRSNLQDAETAAQAAQDAAEAIKKPLAQITLATAREGDGDNGVILAPEGAAQAPVLTLYGLNGDEPVIVRNAAPAERDDDVPTLGQVRELIGQGGNTGGGGGSIIVDEEGYLTTASGGFDIDEDGYIIL